MVLNDDDCAQSGRDKSAGRRGLAGLILMLKVRILVACTFLFNCFVFHNFWVLLRFWEEWRKTGARLMTLCQLGNV